MEYVLLHRHTPWVELFYMLSTTGFWLNATKFDWYIPSLVVLYLAFPLFFRAFRHYGARATGLVGLVGGWESVWLFSHRCRWTTC